MFFVKNFAKRVDIHEKKLYKVSRKQQHHTKEVKSRNKSEKIKYQEGAINYEK